MNRGRSARDITDQHRCSGAADTGHIVMFSQPESCEPHSFRLLGKIERFLKCLGKRATNADRCQIENRESCPIGGLHSVVDVLRYRKGAGSVAIQ